MMIKTTVQLYSYKRYKNDFCIARCEVIVPPEEGTFNKGDGITIKGVMPTSVKEGGEYIVKLEEKEDEKWGMQYMISSFASAVPLDANDRDGQKKFLLSIFTEKQVESMYKAIEDPFTALKNKDGQALIKVKGVQIKTMDSWFRRFEENLAKAKVFVELEEYNLTNNMIDRLIERYGSPDMVVDKVKNNPYVLCTEVEGIGWKTADSIAMRGGMDEYCVERIKAFMLFYLGNEGEKGMSWIIPDELLGAVFDNLGDGMDDSVLTQAVRELIESKKVWASDDKSQIGLMKYHRLEEKLAKEICRIRNAESKIEIPDDWRNCLGRVEQRQGWSFIDEQIDGIEVGLNNNICTITGYGGTGKTSLIAGILEVLKGYSFVQTALAGRAASRMAEVTGEEGYTIHRLLGFPKGPAEKGGFMFNDQEQLPYNIYIIDEGSMISIELFYDLLRAIPSGAKVYILGDPGQLESIGAGNVLHDLISSEDICSVQLTQIHRQAAKSAIITESIKARKGIQLVNKGDAFTQTYGELQDLTIDCFSDSSNTFYKVVQRFSTLMEQDNFDIMETQVIVPMKERGNACTYALNQSIQELYNPADPSKREEYIGNYDKSYYLREGDKVINTRNCYKTEPAIFNGNIGTIVGWDWDEDLGEVMLVDFVGIGVVVLESSLWKGIELAYAITTHKSQGSQFNTVIYALDTSSYVLLNRGQIYTGITRAKKRCYLVCQTSALRGGIGQESVTKRQTHLQGCIHDELHPKLIF